MTLLKKAASTFYLRCAQVTVMRSFATVRGLYDEIHPKFSAEEQEKIVTTLNNSNAEQLSRFNASENQIKLLESYKRKNGPFQSLIDILEIDGVRIKSLEKLCTNIISNNVSNDNAELKKAAQNRKRRHMLTPVLPDDQADTIHTAVGIHLAPAEISWAKLNRENNYLEDWGVWNFDTLLPEKIFSHDNFKLAKETVQRIPSADIYIMETAVSPRRGKSSNMASSHLQQLEFTAMLQVLLNTIPTHNNVLDQTPNKVYYLRNKLSSRLFNVLIGHERVSTVKTISQLLNINDISKSDEYHVPCTPVTVNQHLKAYYLSHNSPTKDFLGHSLMLAITFMDLFVHKNASCIASVTSKARK